MTKSISTVDVRAISFLSFFCYFCHIEKGIRCKTDVESRFGSSHCWCNSVCYLCSRYGEVSYWRWWLLILFILTVDNDSYKDLQNFITVVSGIRPSTYSEPVVDSSPCVSHFIVHARKCWTKGVNTRENRRIPPLRYEWVFQLLDDYPSIDFTINGGVSSFTDMRDLLQRES